MKLDRYSQPYTAYNPDYDLNVYDNRSCTRKIVDSLINVCSDVRTAFNRCIAMVRNIYRWLPVIIDDDSCNNVAIYKIIRHKLVLIRQSYTAEQLSDQRIISKIASLDQAINDIDLLVGDYFGVASEQRQQFVDRYGDVVMWRDDQDNYHYAYKNTKTIGDAINADDAYHALRILCDSRAQEINRRLWNNVCANINKW